MISQSDLEELNSMVEGTCYRFEGVQAARSWTRRVCAVNEPIHSDELIVPRLSKLSPMRWK